MKYWSLSIKMKLITENDDPEKYNGKFMGLFIVGIVINIVAAVFESFTYLDNYKIFVIANFSL